MALYRYEIGETIARSERSVVRRARRKADGASVVIKSLNREYPSAHEVGQLEFEYRILRKLDDPGVIRAFALEPDGERLALVLEDFGGQALVPAGAALPLDRFFVVASSLARALGHVHGHDVIHRDIKPRNILVSPETGTVKLIDFSIASELSKERHGVDAAHPFEGSLPYMSPELTGRMNRDADYRSDYYSLGVTLFELLTGALPFSATDTIGWIHCHISRLPPRADRMNPGVPEMLARVVAKLMAKDPAERYQSAHGLLRDLERCEREWRERGAIAEFPLGERDVPERFQVSQRLFGRETEVASLLGVFHSASRASAKLLLVSGSSGVGKSALIQEIHKAIVVRRGKFASGKFEQLERNVPYAALVQALRGLAKQLLAEPEAQLQVWKRNLSAALHPNGQVLVNLIPELQQVLGPQPAVPELAPREAQARLQRVFREFIRALAQPDHPLVIFIDDLQWADAATPELLVHLLADPAVRHVLVIGAYRDNEVKEGHILLMALKELREQRPDAIHQIALLPLTEESVNHIVADTLRADPLATVALSRAIAGKTAGNPFFVKELLGMLSRDGAFRFAAAEGRWTWDIEAVNGVAVRDNVVDLMVDRLQRLPAETVDCLRLGACIGNHFDLRALTHVTGKPAGALVTALWEAVQQGVVVPVGSSYRLVHEGREYDEAKLSTLGVQYRFQHDRVQQAAYSLLGETERARAHWTLGRYLVGAAGAEDERLFELVNHLNLGRAFVVEEADRAELARLNHLAGQRARRAAAHAIATEYFETSLGLLSAAEWAASADLHFECSRTHAECVFMTGSVDSASVLVDRLIALAPNRVARGTAVELKVTILEHQGKMLEAVDTIRQNLVAFGVELPADPKEIDRRIGEGIGKMQAHLARVRVEDLVRLPELRDPELCTAMNLLYQVIPSAIQTYPPTFILAELVMFDLALTHGATPVSCKNFVDCGIIQGGILGDYDTAYRLGKVAYAMVDRYAPTLLESGVRFVFGGFVSHWRAPFREGLDEFAAAFRAGVELGDPRHPLFARVHVVQRLFLVGRSLEECQAEFDSANAFLEQLNATNGVAGAALVGRVVAGLRGTAEPPKPADTFTKSLLALENAQWLFSYGQAATMASFILGDLELAEAWDAFTTPFAPAGVALFAEADYHLFRALIAAKKYDTETDPARRDELMATLVAAEAKLRKWAENSPANFAHKHGLCAGEIARLRGAPTDDVIGLYEGAVASAGDAFVHMRALAHELIAEYWSQKRRGRVAKAYLEEARYLYERWGAAAKLQELDRRHADWLGTGARSGPRGVSATHTTTAGDADRASALDVESIVKATQAISSEVRADRLFARLMSTIIENAGAQRGCLVVKSESTGEIFVEAEANVGGERADSRVPLPIDACAELCPDLVRYVARSLETIVLDDAARDERYQKDAYVQKNGIKSVLCVPVLSQGRLVAILYAENNAVTRAFTQDRVNLLQVIAAQAAISITNAQLYAGLEAKVAERTRALSERERSLRLVLDSTGDGLLTVDLDGFVQAERSRAASEWFGEPRQPPEAIWALLHGDGPGALATRLSFEQLVEGIFPFELSAAQMPTRVTRGDRTLELGWKPVVEDGATRRVLVTVRDISERIEAEKTEQDARELRDLVGHVLTDKAGFAEVVKDVRALLEVIATAKDYDVLRRALHTLKGNAAMFGFQQLATSCHAVEDDVAERHGRPTPEQVASLRNRFEDSLTRVQGVFGDDFMSIVEVRERDLDRLLRGLAERCDHAALLAFVTSWRDECVEAVLRRFGSQAQRIAKNLGKDIDVLVDDGGVRVPAGELRAVWNGMLHAVRNAVDHGIETPEARVAAGKPPRGRLILRAFAKARELTVQIEDDGRGLDFDALRRAAERQGLPASTREDLVEAMFVDGVTTKDEVTMVSGRGVGMAALRQACQGLGGTVEVDSTPGAGTRFTFRVPLSRPTTVALVASAAE